MSEHLVTDYIGGDVEVDVYFDFVAGQEQARDQEWWPSQVTINSVCVGGDKDNDVLNDLNEDAIERLEEGCFEWMEEMG